MPPEALLRANRAFMSFCAYWASVNHKFRLPASEWTRAINWLSILWSAVVTVTCVLKFFKYPERGGLYDQSDQAAVLELEYAAAAQHAAAGQRLSTDSDGSIDWTQLTLLNYLPRINQFSALYYGLVLITVTTALIWRLYTNLWPPWETAGRDFARESAGGQQFNSALETIHFFMAGPEAPEASSIESSGKRDCGPRNAFSSSSSSFEAQLASLIIEQARDEIVDPECGRAEATTRRRKPAAPLAAAWRRSLLTRVHTNESAAAAAAGTPIRAERPSCSRPNSPTRAYQVLIGTEDFHRDKSTRRWRFLATHVHVFTVIVIGCTLPLCTLTIMGLDRVNQRFGPKLEDCRGDSWRARVNLYLSYYALVEQAYAISQCAIFFIFTNIFIALFHADIIYKARPVRAEIDLLARVYRAQLLRTLPLKQIHRQQLRLWAYFNQITLVDSFLSKYAVVSLVAVVSGLTFGQSFVQIQDWPLKVGAFAALFSNVLSFTYLHLISEHIERQSVPLQTGLLAILANERSPEARREWQRLLNAFYQSDWKRTFTLVGKYPTNLRTYSRIATALLAACTLIHRLFHRAQWNMSFGATGGAQTGT